MVGLARQDNQPAIQLFAIRGGKMIGRDVFLLDAAREASDEEVLSSFLLQYYARATSIPHSVLVPAVLPDAADLEAFLMARRGGPSRLAVPQRGEKRELMALATRNAGETLAREQARWMADEASGRRYLSFASGLRDVSLRWVPTSAWNDWRTEMPWMTLYFSVVVWVSIALMHAPRFARAPGLAASTRADQAPPERPRRTHGHRATAPDPA